MGSSGLTVQRPARPSGARHSTLRSARWALSYDGPSLMMGPLLCRTLGHHDARRGDVDQTTMLRAHVARHMRADPRGGKIDAGLLVAMSLAQFDGRRFTIDAGLGGELTVALQAPLDADDGS